MGGDFVDEVDSERSRVMDSLRNMRLVRSQWRQYDNVVGSQICCRYQHRIGAVPLQFPVRATIQLVTTSRELDPYEDRVMYRGWQLAGRGVTVRLPD